MSGIIRILTKASFVCDKVCVICLLLSLIASGSLFAAGNTASNFLKIPVGARAAGLGEAFTSISDDASAIYWNPSGLSSLKSKQILVSHNVWFQNIQQSYIAIAIPLDLNTVPTPFAQNTIGISINYLGVNDLERRMSNSAVSEGDFGANDLAVTLAYSRNILKLSENPLSFGASLKFIRQTIDKYSADAYAADLGLLYPFRAGSIPFKAGAAVQNLGTQVKFINEAYALPLTFKTGVSCKPLAAYKQPLTVAFDVVFPNDNDTSWRLGTEYAISQIALRLGYVNRSDAVNDAMKGGSFSGNTGGNSAFTGFMAGLGFDLALGRNKGLTDRLTLDYAFIPYGELGDTHRISIGFKW